SFPEITGAVLYIILISLFVLALSCIFGYLVAKISLKLKNKSFITVVISLLFFAGYYFVYFNANTFLSNLIKNINEYGAAIKSKAYPVYVVGRAAEGSALPLVIVCAAVLLVLFLTLFVISRSFLKIATSTAASPKVKYNGKSGKVKTVKVALLYREAKRFVSSPNYMLNCGLGAVFMPAAGIFAVLKGSDIRSLMSTQLSAYEDLIYIGTAAVTFLLVSMNDVAAPSVSLEGKTLWQLRSLPVETKSVLKAKYTLQFYINAVPALFMALCMIIALRPNIPAALLLPLNTLSFCVFHAFFSLFCGLHKVNLNWTNEVVPIKQSMSVVFAVFGGFGYAVLSGVLYFPFSMLNLPYGLIIYLSAFFVINALLSALLYRWIAGRGVKVLEAL
ncbi:MAG: hypothetical protein J6T73_03835, partial [Clostridia bacterium]|nr:hypothetical protein [Clostridia bacterium]